MDSGTEFLIAVVVDRHAAAVTQVGTIPGVVPNGTAILIVEVTPVGVPLIGIYATPLVRLDHEAGEREDVASDIAQSPVVELDRNTVIVANLNVFVRFLLPRTVLENIGDIYVTGRSGDGVLVEVGNGVLVGEGVLLGRVNVGRPVGIGVSVGVGSGLLMIVGRWCKTNSDRRPRYRRCYES